MKSHHSLTHQTFLLDVDLTSLNGNLKSNIPGKRPLDRPDKAKASSTRIRQQTPPIEDDLSATPDTFIDLERPFGPAPNSMQILDFASHNPIISYRNQVYSCTWSDMIGTNMFFSPAPCQLSEPDVPVELLGTSRIRLIGHRAKIAVKAAANAEPARRGRPEKGSDPRAAFVINNSAFKWQADFLEKLKEVKKAKGETDVIRTVSDGSGDLGTSSLRSNTVVEGQ
jgi:hypothetical protein